MPQIAGYQLALNCRPDRSVQHTCKDRHTPVKDGRNVGISLSAGASLRDVQRATEQSKGASRGRRGKYSIIKASVSRQLKAQMSSPRPESSQPSRPAILGVHHIKLAVSNPTISIAWYERVLGARHITALDHVDTIGARFSAVCQMSCWGGLLLELRQNAVQATKDRGWDILTMSIAGRRELLQWIAWLDLCGTEHSPALVGVRGWILVFQVSLIHVLVMTGADILLLQDPDGRRFRLYTREEHGGN